VIHNPDECVSTTVIEAPVSLRARSRTPPTCRGKYIYIYIYVLSTLLAAAGIFGTAAEISYTTLRFMPEDGAVPNYWCENLDSYTR
jgi:hypothetical protein